VRRSFAVSEKSLACRPACAAGAFSVSSTCVSNADYLEFVRAGGVEPRGNPRHVDQRTWVGKHCPPELLDHPVVYVAQADARMFCDWLTEKERAEGRLGAGQRYVLPTLAGWRAFVGDTPLPRDAITDRQWLPGAAQPTVPVGWGEPSSLGLLHVFGNVFEWCQDTTEKDRAAYHLAVGGGWASARGWLVEQVRQKTFGAIGRRLGLPMKDGGFRICLADEAAGPGRRRAPPALRVPPPGVCRPRG
jgi:formylglycine-generating enzyme required for sulfatase activity